jgi:hypothetical protein
MNAFLQSWYDLRHRLPTAQESIDLALLAGVDETAVNRWFAEGKQRSAETSQNQEHHHSSLSIFAQDVDRSSLHLFPDTLVQDQDLDPDLRRSVSRKISHVAACINPI